ncbi:13067_t:CDS:2 [Funneliformis caledonium]|uniref:DNA-directed RNA polymerase n=1 Tax=Funneliformis caledonium TaxID=1117310 RepID=A0A9N9DGZ0_9GLOM|nr:13067_t:CDS:2 [Funneliformis caledonium]
MLTNFTSFYGGYFIINGSEKILISQERLAYNYVYIFKHASPSTTLYSAEFRSSTEHMSKLIIRKAESFTHVALHFIIKDIPIRVFLPSESSTMRTSSIPNPYMTLGLKRGNYEKLDDDGIVSCGVRVCGNDILIGKVSTLSPEDELFGQRKESHVYRDDGAKLDQVGVRNTRISEIGDKFESRHDQKGTIGINYHQEDMPFTADGISPDIIINPQPYDNRTLNCTFNGKAFDVSGSDGDATAFSEVTVESISRNLVLWIPPSWIGSYV